MEKKRKSLYWLFKIMSIVVSCAFPLWAICEKYPLWNTVYGTCEDANKDHKCEYGCDKADGLFCDKNYFNPDLLLQLPEKYKGLQVRLCGWSQYFNKLSVDEQNMLIRQAQTAS